MEYIRGLRAHFKKKYPQFSVPTNIYYGYMDMTYFAILTPLTRAHNLKIGVLFEYANFRFEVYLSGVNRNVGAEYWQIIKDRGWSEYTSADDPKKVDYIIYDVLAEDPDFGDLEALTEIIEGGTLEFIKNVEGFLSTLPA